MRASALELAILHPTSSLFYKTDAGAAVGDLLMKIGPVEIKHARGWDTMRLSELDLEHGAWTAPTGRKVLLPAATGALRTLALSSSSILAPGTPVT